MCRVSSREQVRVAELERWQLRNRRVDDMRRMRDRLNGRIRGVQ